jgi:RNA polymerase sigma-70 factor (ECF subfamily)
MSDQQFAETLAGVQDGEEAAVAALWRALNPPLLRFLRTRHAPQDVDDVASEVWLRASRSWHRFRGNEPAFRAWFFAIARAVSVDTYRRGGRRSEVLVDDVEPRVVERRAAAAESDALDRLGTDRALALIAKLPREQGEAVALRVIAGLDADRVAEIMGKRPGTVRVLQHRGLRKLAELLDPEGVRPEDVTR